MSSQVIITSAKANNGLINVVEHILDDTGTPTGQSRTVATLDDGETLNYHLGPDRIISCLETPRNQPVAAAPVPPAGPQPVEIPVIGGQVTLDPAPAPAETPTAATTSPKAAEA